MTVACYFTNRVYSHTRYRELVSLLHAFLQSNKYVVSDWDDAIRAIVRGDIVEQEDEASVIASPLRTILREYGGFLFRVVNLRRRCASGVEDQRRLPIGVKQRFTGCPNYIEVEGHRVLMGVQEDISRALAGWLNDRKRLAYVRTFEGEFIDLIESAYDDPAEKAAEIHTLVQELVNRRSLAGFQMQQFPAELVFLLSQLHEDTIRVLRTAEILRTEIPDLPDCSAAVIEYCKAVEIELHYKVLEPLRLRWQGLPGAATPAVPKSLRRLWSLVSGSSTSLELGTFAGLLEEALNQTSNPLAQNLVDGVNQLPFGSCQRLVADVLYLTRRFRNPAAHKAVMSSDEMHACRAFVVGSDFRPGLLFRVVTAE